MTSLIVSPKHDLINNFTHGEECQIQDCIYVYMHIKISISREKFTLGFYYICSMGDLFPTHQK